jgi:hypothetical protein
MSSKRKAEDQLTKEASDKKPKPQRLCFFLKRKCRRGKRECLTIHVKEHTVGEFNVLGGSKKLKERKDLLMDSHTHTETGFMLSPIFDLNRQQALRTAGQILKPGHLKRHPQEMGLNAGIVFEIKFSDSTKFSFDDVRFEPSPGLSVVTVDPLSLAPGMFGSVEPFDVMLRAVELESVLHAIDVCLHE